MSYGSTQISVEEASPDKDIGIMKHTKAIGTEFAATHKAAIARMKSLTREEWLERVSWALQVDGPDTDIRVDDFAFNRPEPATDRPICPTSTNRGTSKFATPKLPSASAAIPLSKRVSQP